MNKHSIRLGEKFFKKALPMVIAIILAVATFITVTVKEDWSQFDYVEESFVKLEEIAKSVETDSNLAFYLNDDLTSYNVKKNPNSDITVKLTGKQTQTAIVTANYDEHLNLLSIEREYNSSFLPIAGAIFVMFIVSGLVWFYSKLILELIVFFVFFVLEKIQNKKRKKEFQDQDYVKSDFEF